MLAINRVADIVFGDFADDHHYLLNEVNKAVTLSLIKAFFDVGKIDKRQPEAVAAMRDSITTGS